MSDAPQDDQEPVVTTADASVPSATATSRSPWLWPLALFVAASLAVIAMNYTPRPYAIAQKWLDVGPTSSMELQREAVVQIRYVHWQNSLVAFAVAGACLGLASLFMVRWQNTGRAVLSVIGCVAVGGVCGILAIVVGFALSEQFMTGGFLSSLAADEESMVPDLLIWMAMSVLLALPAGLALLLAGEPLFSQKVVAVPLAGVLTGLLLPIIVSLVLPAEKTSIVPPQGLLVTSMWMGTLAIFLLLFTTFTGSRAAKPAETSVAAGTPA